MPDYSTDLYQQADLKKTELRKELLTVYLDKISDIKKLAKDTLTSLQKKIITEVSEQGKISYKTEELFSEVTDLLSTSGSRIGINVLRKARMYLREAIHPAYPFDFPNPRRILERFQVYRDCFEYAIQEHVVKWEEWLMEGTKQSFQQSISSIDNVKDRINQARQKAKIETID